jgi:hypothetical protein
MVNALPVGLRNSAIGLDLGFKPRYRRAEVEELFRGSFMGENHRAPAPGRPVSMRRGRRSRRWILPGTWGGTACSGSGEELGPFLAHFCAARHAGLA